MATARGACPGAVPRGHAIRDGNWHLDSAGAGDGSPGRGAAGAPPPPPSAHETTLLSGSGPGQARPGQAKPGQARPSQAMPGQACRAHHPARSHGRHPGIALAPVRIDAKGTPRRGSAWVGGGSSTPTRREEEEEQPQIVEEQQAPQGRAIGVFKAPPPAPETEGRPDRQTGRLTDQTGQDQTDQTDIPDKIRWTRR